MRRIPVKLSDEDLRRHLDLKELKRDFPDEAELTRYLYWEEMLSQREIGAILGCCQSAVLKKMKRHGITARSDAEAVIIAAGYAHERLPFDGDDREKRYYMGFVKGDCHVEKRFKNSLTIEVKCHSTIPEQIKLFKELFKPYGHFRKRKGKEGSIQATVSLDLESFAWLLDLGDYIPPLALTNDENFFAFLGGYSDAEGRIGLDKGGAIFKLASCDKVILHQIYERLMNLGIKFPEPEMILPAGYVDKRGIKCNQDFWRLYSQCKETLLVLFERLGPYLRHQHKVEGMRAAIRNIEERNARLERAHRRKERFRKLLATKEEPPHRFPDEAELIRYLHDEEELFQWEIGEIIGCCASAVGRKMKRYGIKARTRSDARKVVWGHQLRS